jgi:hypothetical protein
MTKIIGMYDGGEYARDNGTCTYTVDKSNDDITLCSGKVTSEVSNWEGWNIDEARVCISPEGAITELLVRLPVMRNAIREIANDQGDE